MLDWSRMNDVWAPRANHVMTSYHRVLVGQGKAMRWYIDAYSMMTMLGHMSDYESTQVTSYLVSQGSYVMSLVYFAENDVSDISASYHSLGPMWTILYFSGFITIQLIHKSSVRVCVREWVGEWVSMGVSVSVCECTYVCSCVRACACVCVCMCASK